MNSRERVLAALNYRQPDRVPIDLGAYHSSTIMAIAYAKLRDYLGLPKKPIKVYDMPQQLALIDDDVLERFNVDTVDLSRAFSDNDADWHEWVLPDGTECLIPRWCHPTKDENGSWLVHGPDGTPIAIQKPGMLYFDQVYFPFAENPAEKVDRLEELFDYNMWFSSEMAPPPGPISWNADGMRVLSEGAKRLRASTDRAINAIFGGSIFEGSQMFWRMDNFYLALGSEPELMHRFLDKLVDIYMKRLDMYIDAVGPYVDIIMFSDDYGMQTGPQISPRMFREFFKPRYQKMWDMIKARTEAKIMMHSCGSINALLPDMIGAGLDAVNPVQTNTKDMEPAVIKNKFRDQITFWGGGCDTRYVLPNGTPEEVRQNVFENLDILFPGGGFVFQQVHNIQADVPPENIVAMFDAVAEWNEMHT
ncbi:MAG: methyltransferase [Anaerolineaceae bacterium]|nr:methyltransferase [Anaerolineaceae bacterium]